MGILKSSARFIAYPIIRPYEEVAKSLGRIKRDVTEAKRIRARRVERDLQDKAEHERRLDDAGGGFAPSAEELQAPGAIKNPRVRFEVIARQNNWTDEELLAQLTAVRLAKRVAIFAAVLLLVGALVLMAIAPLWMAIVISPLAGVASALMLASSLRYALFQHQLQQRSLVSLGGLLSRPDLFRYLFSA